MGTVEPRGACSEESGAGLGTGIGTGGAVAFLEEDRLECDLFGDGFFGVVRFGGSSGFGVKGFAGAVVFAEGAVVTGSDVRPCNIPKLEVPGKGMPRVLHILFK